MGNKYSLNLTNIVWLIHYYYFAGCNNNKNKAGYNRLEADDFDSDGEFSRKGKILLLNTSKSMTSNINI